MQLFRLRSLDEYKHHVQKNMLNYDVMKQFESRYSNSSAKEFTIRGISYPAKQYVDFKVDYLYSDGKNINWRERIVCPITNLNNRLRSSIHLLDMELSPYPESEIYITEQVTSLFSFFKDRFINLKGSEYLGDNLRSGIINDGIRHEDMTLHSFSSESLDFYLTFECFEHIPFYKKAISEAYRVLKKGGSFLGSFPFDINQYHNFKKATINENGEVVFFTDPEYHGDPVNEKGILCYTIFGWEALDEFRSAGFNDVYVILLWSDMFGYLGGEQIFFIAKK